MKKKRILIFVIAVMLSIGSLVALSACDKAESGLPSASFGPSSSAGLSSDAASDSASDDATEEDSSKDDSSFGGLIDAGNYQKN